MSSLTWSLGRYNVSLVSHCAIPSWSSWQRPSSRGTLGCKCALHEFPSSAIPHIVVPRAVPSDPESPSGTSKGHRLLESVHSNDEPPSSAVIGDYLQQRSGLLRSVLSVVVALAMTTGIQGAPSSRDTFEDVPQTLSGGDKGRRIQKPNSAKAETCTRKCVSTCIRGGAGAPGEGPLNVRRPLVVFKEGFRSRNYCLIECSDICNLIGDGDDGP